MRIVLTSCGKVEINEKDEHQSQFRQNSLPKEISKIEISTPNNTKSYRKNKSIKNNLHTRVNTEIKNNNIFSQRNILDHQKPIQKKRILSLAGMSSLIKNNELNFPIDNNQINTDNDKTYKIIEVKKTRIHLPKEVKALYNNININNDLNSNDEYNLISKKYKNDKSSRPSSLFTKSGTEESLPVKGTKNNGVYLDELLNTRNKIKINKRLLKKQISNTDTSLINYLQSKKNIQPSFINKINMANENKLSKLDKICQKYFQNERENDILNSNIKDKLKLEHRKEFERYSNDIKDIGYNFKSYENLCKNLIRKQKNYIDNRVLFLKYKKI